MRSGAKRGSRHRVVWLALALSVLPSALLAAAGVPNPSRAVWESGLPALRLALTDRLSHHSIASAKVEAPRLVAVHDLPDTHAHLQALANHSGWPSDILLPPTFIDQPAGLLKASYSNELVSDVARPVSAGLPAESAPAAPQAVASETDIVLASAQASAAEGVVEADLVGSSIEPPPVVRIDLSAQTHAPVAAAMPDEAQSELSAISAVEMHRVDVSTAQPPQPPAAEEPAAATVIEQAATSPDLHSPSTHSLFWRAVNQGFVQAPVQVPQQEARRVSEVEIAQSPLVPQVDPDAIGPAELSPVEQPSIETLTIESAVRPGIAEHTADSPHAASALAGEKLALATEQPLVLAQADPAPVFSTPGHSLPPPVVSDPRAQIEPAAPRPEQAAPLAVSQDIKLAALTPEPKEVWRVPPSVSLRQMLMEWAARAGWIVTWDASVDYETMIANEFRGDFEDAIYSLFNAFPASIPLRAELRTANVPPLLIVTQSRRPLQ